MAKNDNKPSKKSSKISKQSKLKKAIKKLKIFEKKLKAKEKGIDKKLKKLRYKKLKEKRAIEAKENLIKSSNKKVELKKKKRSLKKQKEKTTSASLDKKALIPKEPSVDNINDANSKSSSIDLTAREAIASFRDITAINEIEIFIKKENRVSILRAASSRKNAIQKSLDKSQSS